MARLLDALDALLELGGGVCVELVDIQVKKRDHDGRAAQANGVDCDCRHLARLWLSTPSDRR